MPLLTAPPRAWWGSLGLSLSSDGVRSLGAWGFCPLLPIAVSLPQPGCGHVTKVRVPSAFGPPLLNFAGKAVPLGPWCPAAGHAPPRDREAVSLDQESTRLCTKKKQGETTCCPQGPSAWLRCSWMLPRSASSSVPFHLMSFELSSCHLTSPDQ